MKKLTILFIFLLTCSVHADAKKTQEVDKIINETTNLIAYLYVKPFLEGKMELPTFLVNILGNPKDYSKDYLEFTLEWIDTPQQILQIYQYLNQIPSSHIVKLFLQLNNYKDYKLHLYNNQILFIPTSISSILDEPITTPIIDVDLLVVSPH